MRASLIAIALMLPVGIALAQKEPGNQSKGSGSNTAATSGNPAQNNSSKQGNTAEVKTKTYKGTLVDAACAGGGASSSSSQTSSASTTKSGEANRTAGNSQSCDATTNTSEFGLKTRDGNVMRFDAVGDDRAKQAISSRKKWADRATAGKPIRASVSGMETGDKLTVVSIH